MRERREEEEENLADAKLNVFKELKLSIQLEDTHAPPTPPTVEGYTVTGDTLEVCETTTLLEVDQEDGREVSIHE